MNEINDLGRRFKRMDAFIMEVILNVLVVIGIIAFHGYVFSGDIAAGFVIGWLGARAHCFWIYIIRNS